MRQLARDNRVFIGLGSNLGDPVQNLAQAVRLLQESFQTKLVSSSLYQSEPVDLKEQPWFVNQVVYFAANPDFPPHLVLEVLKTIERRMGRVPTVRFGPRLIDLDLLFYKNWVLESSRLIIPHPRIAERSFVLMPLLELDPNLAEPRSGLTVEEIWEQNRGLLGKCSKME